MRSLICSGRPTLGERHLARGVELPALLRGDGVRGEAHPPPTTHHHQPPTQALQEECYVPIVSKFFNWVSSALLPYQLLCKRRCSSIDQAAILACIDVGFLSKRILTNW